MIGRKETVIEQLFEAASCVPHVVLARTNGAVVATVIFEIVIAWPPTGAVF